MIGPSRAELLEQALAMAARGWRVLPLHYPTGDGCSCVVAGPVDARCADEGKHPHTRHGTHDASTDRARIRRWWASKPWNVGVATGDGLLVLDVDPRHGGDVALDVLEAQHGPLPRGVVACTGGGGLHLWFRYDAARGVPCSAARLGSGLDVRADGGYVVAPPSVHASGRVYGWELSSDPEDVALDAAPAWLLDAARDRQGRRPRFVAAAGSRPRPAPSSPAGELIPAGERNAALYRRACSLRAAGLDAGALLAALLDENQARCAPPLAEDEVEKIAANAARHPPGLSRGFQAQRSRGERAAELAARFGRRSA